MQLPLKATITVGAQKFVWNGTGALPTDYYIQVGSDGRLTMCLGALGVLSPQVLDKNRPYHLPAHNVLIQDANDNTVLNQDCIGHWWNSRWTARTQPLVATVSPAQIVAARRMFPLGDMGKPFGQPSPRWAYVNPMDTAGITIGYPTTGERAEIGLITDASAEFMLTGIATSMFAFAQAANSCPEHFRDEATGLPIDLFKYWSANAYDLPGYMGVPYLMKGPVAANGYPAFGGGWQPQQAHYYELSYVAYMASHDETFLENLQYGANFVILTDAAISLSIHQPIPHGEYRGIAWALRTLFMAHIATKDAEARGALPKTCFPSKYFKDELDDTLAYLTAKYMNDPNNQVFNLVTDAAIVGNPPIHCFAPWQVIYMLHALAFGVLTGHIEWVPLYNWALKNQIDRLSGTSGYPPGYGGAYYLPILSDWKTAWLTGIPILGGAEPPTQAQIDILAKDQFNNFHLMVGAEYTQGARSVMVHAQYLSDNWTAFGLPAGQSPRNVYPNLDFCASVVHRMVMNTGGQIDPRQSYVVSAVPSTTNPVKDLAMSTPFELKPDETTKQLNLTVTPPDGDVTSLTFRAVPSDAVTLTPNAAGVLVTRVAGKKGAVAVFADVNGVGGVVEAESDGVVDGPLVVSLSLDPAS